MTVIVRRGRPTWPTTTAITMAPIPPTAKIAPRASASSSSRFFTRNGRRTSSGPTKTIRLSIELTRVAQIQGLDRT